MQWMPYNNIKAVKYLGFTIDNKSDFHQHIKAIEKKWHVLLEYYAN